MCIDMLITHFKSIPLVTYGQKLKINMLIATILFCDKFFPVCEKTFKKEYFVTNPILKKDYQKVNFYFKFRPNCLQYYERVINFFLFFIF